MYICSTTGVGMHLNSSELRTIGTRDDASTILKLHEIGNITCLLIQSPLYRQQFPSTAAAGSEI